jgi:IPT/TIG domain-containing protein
VGRLTGRVSVLELLVFASVCIGCGGGSAVTQQPPPMPDFSLSLSTNSISISQGGTSSAVSVSINPGNGFTGNVKVTLSGIPAGLTSNPASPFDVAAGASTSVVFGAASNAATGNFTVAAQGSSGALSHSQTLALTVQAGVSSMLPRSSYVRTDSVVTADVSFGGATLTIRGSGFVNGVGIAINGKTATVTFKDANTLSVTIPPLTPGPPRITISNPEGESVSLDAAITAN